MYHSVSTTQYTNWSVQNTCLQLSRTVCSSTWAYQCRGTQLWSEVHRVLDHRWSPSSNPSRYTSLTEEQVLVNHSIPTECKRQHYCSTVIYTFRLDHLLWFRSTWTPPDSSPDPSVQFQFPIDPTCSRSINFSIVTRITFQLLMIVSSFNPLYVVSSCKSSRFIRFCQGTQL